MRVDQAIEELEALSRTMEFDCQDYWQFHKRRYRWTAQLLSDLAHNQWEFGGDLKLLDVGLSFQTLLFSKILPYAAISILGYGDDRYASQNDFNHIFLDLNETYYPEKCPVISEKYDVITMLEVIEHLNTPPIRVLSFLKKLLRPDGLLIVQTPNAVSLRKRYELLCGRNPFELIRENVRDNPGHVREYTVSELCGMAGKSGLHVDKVYFQNYFEVYPSMKERILRRASDFLGGEFMEGLTILFKPAENWSDS